MSEYTTLMHTPTYSVHIFKKSGCRVDDADARVKVKRSLTKI